LPASRSLRVRNAENNLGLSFTLTALILPVYMNLERLLAAVLLVALCACAGFETGGEFTRGRLALVRGDLDSAIANFQSVADANPQFVARNGPLWEGIWTYVGRAHYQSGKYAQAKEALEKALAQQKGDHMARLYLGLTLARLPATPVKNTGFSVQDIAFALREGIEPERVAALARERGVAFDLSRESEIQLRKAGADPRLLDEIKKIRAEALERREPHTGRGAKELAAALAGLRDDLDSFIATTSQGRFWDPGGELRKEIRSGIALLSARDQDWKKIITNGEWLGQNLEEEIDRARRDEAESLRRPLQR
jgi:tetratricopeptide (TPR) repeat protein